MSSISLKNNIKQENNQLKNQTTLQCKPLDKTPTNFSLKRTPFLTFIYKKASLTLEAALVLPIFMFAMMQFMTIFLIYEKQMNAELTLHQSAKKLAVAAYSVNAAANDCVDLHMERQEKPIFRIVSFQTFYTSARCVIRKFTGYDVNQVSSYPAEEEMVYVTPNGTVFHRDRGCNYLDLTIKSTTTREIGTLRNKNGNKYYKCKYCPKAVIDLVYIADYGTRYHTSIGCSELKRTVEAIPISQVGNKKACSKCGG